MADTSEPPEIAGPVRDKGKKVTTVWIFAALFWFYDVTWHDGDTCAVLQSGRQFVRFPEVRQYLSRGGSWQSKLVSQ